MKDTKKSITFDQWLDSDVGYLVFTGLTTVVLGFVTALVFFIPIALFAPSTIDHGETFRYLWECGIALWIWPAISAVRDKRAQRIAADAAKAQLAEEKRLRQVAKIEAKIIAQREKELEETLLRERLELERQQGIYAQNRMNERMQEVGLPRMAANAADFEFLAAQWVYVWGDSDVKVTQHSHDGGIDVQSACCLGQVKFYADSKVTTAEVQQLKGASSVDSKRIPVFFAFCSGYTNDAITFANQAGASLYQFQAESLTFIPVNAHAVDLLDHLHSHL